MIEFLVASVQVQERLHRVQLQEQPQQEQDVHWVQQEQQQEQPQREPDVQQGAEVADGCAAGVLEGSISCAFLNISTTAASKTANTIISALLALVSGLV